LKRILPWGKTEREFVAERARSIALGLHISVDAPITFATRKPGLIPGKMYSMLSVKYPTLKDKVGQESLIDGFLAAVNPYMRDELRTALQEIQATATSEPRTPCCSKPGTVSISEFITSDTITAYQQELRDRLESLHPVVEQMMCGIWQCSKADQVNDPVHILKEQRDTWFSNQAIASLCFTVGYHSQDARNDRALDIEILASRIENNHLCL
jgi:hypothetical protein